MQLKTPTNHEIDKIIHAFVIIANDQGTVLLIVLRKKDMTSKTGNPLVIGTNLLITTDALNQMNTIDTPLPNKNLGAEPEIFFRVITKVMTIIIVLSFTTTLLAHHRIIRCNDIPIHIIKIVLQKMQTRDRVLEVLNSKTALMKFIEIIVGKDTDLSMTA